MSFVLVRIGENWRCHAADVCDMFLMELLSTSGSNVCVAPSSLNRWVLRFEVHPFDISAPTETRWNDWIAKHNAAVSWLNDVKESNRSKLQINVDLISMRNSRIHSSRSAEERFDESQRLSKS